MGTGYCKRCGGPTVPYQEYVRTSLEIYTARPGRWRTGWPKYCTPCYKATRLGMNGLSVLMLIMGLLALALLVFVYISNRNQVLPDGTRPNAAPTTVSVTVSA